MKYEAAITYRDGQSQSRKFGELHQALAFVERETRKAATVEQSTKSPGFSLCWPGSRVQVASVKECGSWHTSVIVA